MIKTVTTTTGVNTVTFPEFFKYFWIKNIGDTTVYASAFANVSAGVDNTSIIKSGDTVCVENIDNDNVYISGEGSVEIHAQNYAECPFKVGAKGGEAPDLSLYATKAELDTKAEKELYGNYGINLGRLADSTVGFLSSTIGRANAATGGYSFSQGFDNTASGVASFAGGQSSVADGENALAHGYFAKTTKDNEKAFGKYNKSSSDTLFSVGDGTANDARHNAFEITTAGGKLHDKEISTTPIKSTIINGTTNEHGDVYLWGANEGKIPISACGSPDTVFSPFLNGDSSIYMLHAISVYTDSPVASTAVTATVYYF